MQVRHRFYLTHVALPGACLGLALVAVHLLRVDYRLADAIYAWGGHQWRLRHTWLLEILIHEHGKTLVRSLPVLLLVTYGASYFHRPLQRYQRGLLYLIVIPLCAVSLIGILKRLSGTACPAQLLTYGGTRMLTESWLFPHLGQRGCTPAGHSSGAYAWLATYFFMRIYFPGRKYYGLVLPLLLGLIYGIAQQLRGDHFLSHDLWTLLICWNISLFGSLAFFGSAITKDFCDNDNTLLDASTTDANKKDLRALCGRQQGTPG